VTQETRREHGKAIVYVNWAKKAVSPIKRVFKIRHIHQLTKEFVWFSGTAFFIQFIWGFRTLERF
jgi:hypothetical protein